ncbi:Acetyl esterase/lipase [Rhizobiales bacterium GAS113]|nr:Acetyl esterase/lipase [Rhizobiales bacterium GAS113]
MLNLRLKILEARMASRVFVWPFVYTALSLLTLACGEAAQDDRSVLTLSQTQVAPTVGRALSTNDSIQDLLNHPAFAGFAQLLLPWDDRRYDPSMRLTDIGTLMPYHSHVDPATSVAALNHMIAEANTGQAIFYSFYSERQKQEQPAKAKTGLFFFRGKPGAPFAVISPGGGFAYVGSLHEGFPYAAEISDKGYNAFVLKYRAGYGAKAAVVDLAAAITFIFNNAASLGVGTDGYSLWGSSAGARLAASIGSHGLMSFGGDDLPKPATVVMVYTAHADYSSNEPPTFVVAGEQDGIAPPSSMERRVSALRGAGTEVDYRKFHDLGHGFGPGIGTSAEGWLDDAIRFWEKAIKIGNRRGRRYE